MTDVKSILDQIVAWARTQPEIIALYLYGSVAADRANRLSDVDVAVLARDDLSRQTLWQLEGRWLARWPESLDLRILNLAPLSFRYEATAHGQRLWAADLDLVSDWESLTWRQYWDLRPLLERDWQRYVRRVMERQDEAERQQYQAALARVRAVHRRVREASAEYTVDAEE
jgi:predicted nucleotidyltransferase